METIQSPSKASLSGNDEPLTPADAVRRLIELDDEAARQQWITHCLNHIPADEMLPYLKDESGRYLNIDPHTALRLAEALVSAGEFAKRPEYRALGMMAIGDAFGVLGRYEESVAAMDAAADEYLALGDEVGWARTRNGWLRSSHRLGHGEAALPMADRARELLTENGVPYRAATLDFSIAMVCAELGRHDEALVRYDRAQAAYVSLGETAERAAAQLKSSKAILLTQLGDFQTALRLHEESLRDWMRYGETISVLRQAHCVAYVHAAQGHYTRALHCYSSVLVAYKRANLNYEIIVAAINMAECYLNLNRHNEARELAEETVRHSERCGAVTEAARARFYGALAHAKLGNVERALAHLDEAVRGFTVAGLSTYLALVTLQRATLYLNDGDWSAAIAHAEHARTLFGERGLVIRQAQADLIRARASFAQGDHETAAACARSVLRTSRERDVRWLAHEAHHVLGNVADARGNHEAALGAYDDAVKSIERLQSSFAIELRTNFLEDKIQVYQDAIAASLRLSRPETAFAYLERAKSRALVDYLANNLEVQIKAREGADQEMLDTLARLREEHNWFYNRLYGYGFAEGGNAGPTLSHDALQAAIKEREKQISRILERLALDRTEGLAVVASSEANAHPVLPALDADTVLLEYYLPEEGGAVFVVSPNGLTVVPLAVRPAEIHRLLHQWHLNLTTTARAIASNAPLDGLGRNARGILGMLYRALIAPVAAQIAEYERLIVVPYGPSHAVPFHALFDGERFLLEQIEISVCPSSNLLQLCANRPQHAGRSALVVAHSDGGRLPAVLDEARAVAALLPGECYVEDAATRDVLIAAAPRHRVLHLAVHGEARLDNPAFAHVKLADGQLSTMDIFNLNVSGALVTLSACEMGRSVVTGGDELIGLSRGFLYAGAATLVQSLWRVEDGTTAMLMRRFYAELCAGRTKGVALREAQRALLATNGVHPYFWAPFQLIGDRGLL